MRTLIFFFAVLSTGARAYSQAGTAPPPTSSQREGIAVGVVATPALEDGGPWFMPAIRVSAPLGSRAGVDVDTGRVVGASSKFADIRRFHAAQIRVLRMPRASDGSARYWLAGLLYLDTTKLDGQGTVINHTPHTALSIGHGWGHVFQNGTRAINEIGFSGGDGFMFYGSVGVQWGPPRKEKTP